MIKRQHGQFNIIIARFRGVQPKPSYKSGFDPHVVRLRLMFCRASDLSVTNEWDIADMTNL